jgi:hypothetical protein
MKKHIITVLSIFVTFAITAGNGSSTNEKSTTRLVSGKVVDKVSGEEIAGAEIKIADKIIYTDLNGAFLATIPAITTTAVISFVSYSETVVTLSPFSGGEMVVALESK